MAIPDTDLARASRWCERRIPAQYRAGLRLELEVAGQAITIVERRPPWRPDLHREWSRSPVARLRYNATTRRWTLYWRDRNQRFHRYDLHPLSARLEDLLAEIDRDPTGIFWG